MINIDDIIYPYLIIIIQIYQQIAKNHLILLHISS